MQVKVYQATTNDAEALFGLNERFNGVGCTSLELIKESLGTNVQEAVFIVEVDGNPAGFCCVQVFKSMCYSRHYAEITEFFIDQECRRRGVGTQLMRQVEEYFTGDGVAGFQLFTGGNNRLAQGFYERLGYIRTDEIMYRKRYP